jgi:tetratricopeptide (TPR) repeat protein
MRKTFWSLLFVLGIIAYAGQIRAEDESKKPDAVAPKAEGKAEEPKKEEVKKEEVKKEDSKKEEKKKESVERRMERRKKAIENAAVKEDWDKVLAGLDEIIDDKEINKDDVLQAMLTKFMILAEEKLDGAKASPVAKKLGELLKEDADSLNDLAWTILDTEGLKNRDLDLALDLAKKANELTQGQSGEILDTLARAYFEKGDLDKAVELQTKAVEKMKDNQEATDEEKGEVTAALEKFKAKQAEKKNEKKEEKKELGKKITEKSE